MKKGQTWSTDAVVAVVIFILAAMVMFYLIGPAAKNRATDKLQAEAKLLPGALSANQNLTIIFIQGTQVDELKLSQILRLSYENVKSLLGIQSDFCIYFEDDKGNLVEIRPGIVGIGSDLVKVAGRSCGGISDGEKLVCQGAADASACDGLGDFGLTPAQCCTFVGVCC